MTNTKRNFRWFYILSIVGTLLASAYPLYMGYRVVNDMVRDGTVLAENYPKYIIPYTPISLAVIFGVLLMPLIIRFAKCFALSVVSVISVGIFFTAELMFERMVFVTTQYQTLKSTLESWQMFMCAYAPSSYITKTWTAVDVLMGEYSPAFKIHFYIISVVLILSLLNCFYGFAKMIKEGNKSKLKPLVLQALSSLIFLGLCILACFTAFFRDGNIVVSANSALLMSLFFIIFGITMGIYVGSIFYGKKKWLSLIIPSVIASVMTTVMYIGEMVLLGGNLYRLGSGPFFDGIGSIVFAPVDLLIIIISGGICALLLFLASIKNKYAIWIAVAAFVVISVVVGLVTISEQVKVQPDNDIRRDGHLIYIYNDSTDTVKPELIISQHSDDFEIVFSDLTIKGKYKIEDRIFTFTSDDGKGNYVFRPINNLLVFDESKSSKLPLPDNAYFHILSVNEHGLTVYAENYSNILYDIDGDGKDELCSLETSLESDHYILIITIKKDGKQIYQNTFETSNIELLFRNVKGEIKLMYITSDEKPETHYLDIFIRDGKIVLSENGVEKTYFEN